MRTAEAEGRTVEEAVAKALQELGLRREQVRVEVLSKGIGRFAAIREWLRRGRSVEKRSGLFGLLGGRQARVRVIPLEEEALGKARTVLEAILERMRVQGRITASWRDRRILLEVKSFDGGLLIGRGGRTLEALQYLVNRILDSGEERIEKVVVDVEGYRRRREEELRTLSLRLAAKARVMKEPIATIPLSPHDRRIVHLTLQEDRGVKTASEGTGFYRRVIISPQQPMEDSAAP